MALSADEKRRGRNDFLPANRGRAETVAFDRLALEAAFDAAESYWAQNLAGYFARLPEPFKSTATTKQKVEVLIQTLRQLQTR